MEKTTFVLGGCRSGKSQHALDLAEALASKEKIFIATCVPQDEEMNQRVANHQRQRGGNWKTVEAPLELPQAIADCARVDTVLVADCLTLWMNNLLMENEDAHHAETNITELIQSLKAVDGPVILVSNEVGTGIVPENKLARMYRDLVGSLNQAVAKVADEVVLVVAGIPVKIK